MSLEMPAALAARFAPEELLGSGSFGRVLRVRPREGGSPAALKLLHGAVQADEGLRRRFEREAELAARVESPHVARVLEAGVADGVPYLLSEYVSGPTLEAHRLQAGGRLAPEEAGELLVQLLRGLEAAETAGVIHRDLKPENVLLRQGKQVVITDFGLARGEGLETMTATGQILGTPLYMAPEQLQGKGADASWDRHAACVIYLELVLGRLPFEAEGPAELLGRKLAGLPSSLVAMGAEVPPQLDRVIRRELGPDSAARAPSARALLAEVQEALQGVSQDVGATAELAGAPGPEEGPSASLRATTRGELDALAAPVPGSEGLRSGDAAARPGRPSVGGGARRRGAAWLGLGALVALGVATLGGGGSGAPPLPPDTTPLEPPWAAPAAAVREAWARLRGNREVFAALDLVDVVGNPDPAARSARTTWSQGRWRFQKTTLRLGPQLEALAPHARELDVATTGALAEMALAERLFHAGQVEGVSGGRPRSEPVGPLYPPGEAPQALEILRRRYAWWTDPSLDPSRIPAGMRPTDPAALRVLAHLRAEPGEWVQLYPLPPASSGLRVRTFGERLLADHRQKVGDLINEIGDQAAQSQTRDVAEDTGVALAEIPPGEPLDLTVMTYDWSWLQPPLLELRGGSGPAVLVPLLLPPPTEGPARNLRHVAYRVQVLPRDLPPRPRSLRVTPRGIQGRGVGEPSFIVNLDGVYQRVGGAPVTPPRVAAAGPALPPG